MKYIDNVQYGKILKNFRQLNEVGGDRMNLMLSVDEVDGTNQPEVEIHYRFYDYDTKDQDTFDYLSITQGGQTNKIRNVIEAEKELSKLLGQKIQLPSEADRKILEPFKDKGIKATLFSPLLQRPISSDTV